LNLFRFQFSNIFAAITLSGAAALGWQFVWTYQFGLQLGHEFIAVLSVMAAFLGGLSVGSFAFHNVISKSSRPEKWFIASEFLIACWGLTIVYLLPNIGTSLSRMITAEPTAFWHWLVAFGVPLVLLLPASVAMGITLPALELKAINKLPQLYSLNTLGAVLGVLVIVFLAIPTIGIRASAFACAGANVAAAILVFLAPKTQQNAQEHVSRAAYAGVSRLFLWLALFGTGLLGVGYQVLVVRILSQVNENTVYSYAVVLVIYLLGTSIGGWWGKQNDIDQSQSMYGLETLLVQLLLAVCISGIALWWADVWVHVLVNSPLLGEALAAMSVLLLPSIAMGRVFTYLCELSKQGARISVGRALAINTLGSAIAPFVVAVLLFPSFGAGYSLAAIVLGYIVLIFLTRTLSPEQLKQRFGAAPRFTYAFICTACALVVFGLSSQRPLRFVDVPEGGRLEKYEDGILASVSVVLDKEGISRLHINNREQEGSSAQSAIETKLGLIPILLHPAPGRALFLGYGTGYTATTAARDTRLKVTAVELLPEVVSASNFFQDQTSTGRKARAALKVTIADGRRYVQSGQDQFDVIVSDLFHPARNGAGSLYSVEHFENIKQRLAPEGVFCQWLALHQMELGTLQSITAAYLKAFPNAVAVLASNSLDSPVIGLISKGDAQRGTPFINIDLVEERLRLFSDTALLKQAKLNTSAAVLGTIFADSDSLHQWIGGREPNTDNHPVVIHEAPWTTYGATISARARLMTLMAASTVTPPKVFASKNEQAYGTLAAYWKARQAHLQLGTRVVAELDPEKMLNQIQRPMLDILAGSPDFQPAVDPLVSLASVLASNNPTRAREVLMALVAIRPTDTQVQQALARLNQ
jgi:spermidine synthase